MTMPMMTMSLLGASNAGAPNTGILHLGTLASAPLQTALPLAGDVSQKGREQAPFAEMLATAGVPSTSVVGAIVQTAKAVGSPMVPVAVETVKVPAMTATVETIQGITQQTPRLKVSSQAVNTTEDAPQVAHVEPAAKMPMLEAPIPEGAAENSMPALAIPTLQSSALPAKTPATATFTRVTHVAVDRETSVVAIDREGLAAPLMSEHAVLPIPAERAMPKAAAMVIAANLPALAPPSEASALDVSTKTPLAALRPKTAVRSLPASLADVAEAPAPVVSSAAPALEATPSLPGPVAAPSAPALAVAQEAPVKPTDVSEAPEVAEIKTVKVAKGWKTHSFEVPGQDSKARTPEAAVQEKRASEAPAPAANEVVTLAIPVVATMVQQAIAPPIVQDTGAPVPASGRTAGSLETMGAEASRPTPAAQPVNAPQEISPVGSTTAEAGIAPALVMHEQVQGGAPQAAPPSIAVAKAIQRLAQGEAKAAPEKHTHSGLAAIASSDTSAVAASPLVPVAPATEAKHTSTQDAGATVVPHAVTVATPAVEAMRGVTTPEPHAASIVPSGLSAQPMESVVPTQPGLAHTTLSASPTVLEVGVPGGSHGWLKIRAELVEGGTVQASLVAASHAGHETLHRELPEMTAFLAGEQLSVQLHVADRPQSSVSSSQVEQDFAQTLAGGEGSGGERGGRAHEEPSASASSFVDEREIDWISSSYIPSTALRGGSWVNVVA